MVGNSEGVNAEQLVVARPEAYKNPSVDRKKLSGCGCDSPLALGLGLVWNDNLPTTKNGTKATMGVCILSC